MDLLLGKYAKSPQNKPRKINVFTKVTKQILDSWVLRILIWTFPVRLQHFLHPCAVCAILSDDLRRLVCQAWFSHLVPGAQKWELWPTVAHSSLPTSLPKIDDHWNSWEVYFSQEINHDHSTLLIRHPWGHPRKVAGAGNQFFIFIQQA